MDTKFLSILLFSFLAFVLSASFSSAQLGEVAGQPSFNVSLGGSESFTITVLNSGSTPMPVQVILPTLNNIANTTTPTVTANPISGTIPPDSSMNINVTVSMPSNSKNLGHVWTGVLQVVENYSTPGSSSGGMGATFKAGVAKIVTITAHVPKFNILEFLVPVVVVIVIGGAGAYYYAVRKKAAAAAQKRGRRMKAAKAIKKTARAKRPRKPTKRTKARTRTKARSTSAGRRRSTKGRR